MLAACALATSTPLGNNTFTFTTAQQFPGLTPTEVHDIMQPLYDKLSTSLGLTLSNPVPGSYPYASGGRDGGGDGPVQTRYRSRLFPRANWNDDALWNSTVAAVRASLEQASLDYYFHGIMHSPTEQVAGWPGPRQQR